MDSSFFIENNIDLIKQKIKNGKKFDISFYPIRVSEHWVQYIVRLISKEEKLVFTHIIDAEFVHDVFDYSDKGISKWDKEIFSILIEKFKFLKKINRL
jgi:hypothetical protein